MTALDLRSYFEALFHALDMMRATDGREGRLHSGVAAAKVIDHARNAGRIVFIGNGGSAAIASHMATDYAKVGGFRATALNDFVALTCLGNDLGFEHVFSFQLEGALFASDVLVAISSSGESADILEAVHTARAKAATVVTFSGFAATNPLRKLGDLNFWVDSRSYGHVEIAHLTLLHAILDLSIAKNRDG